MPSNDTSPCANTRTHTPLEKCVAGLTTHVTTEAQRRCAARAPPFVECAAKRGFAHGARVSRRRRLLCSLAAGRFSRARGCASRVPRRRPTSSASPTAEPGACRDAVARVNNNAAQTRRDTTAWWKLCCWLWPRPPPSFPPPACRACVRPTHLSTGRPAKQAGEAIAAARDRAVRAMWWRQAENARATLQGQIRSCAS